MQNNFKRPEQNRMPIPQKENHQEKSRTQGKSKVDSVLAFLYDAFWKTPAEKLETIIEFLLLGAGGFRTVEFLRNMGQNAYMSVIGLVYAELMILVWEYLGYKGKKVKMDTQLFWERQPVKRYPIFNQKSVARWGLIVHLIMSAVFTTSDILLTTLKNLAGASYNVDTMFGWVLGFGIGTAFALDLIFLLVYKNTDPEFKHRQEMEQLDYEIKVATLELSRIEKQAEIDYKKKNASPLAQTRAKLNMQEQLQNEFGERLGRDYVDNQLEKIDLPEGGSRPQRPQFPQRPISDNGGNRPTPPREQVQNRHEENDKPKEQIVSTLTSPVPEHDATNFTIPLQKK